MASNLGSFNLFTDIDLSRLERYIEWIKQGVLQDVITNKEATDMFHKLNISQYITISFPDRNNNDQTTN